MLNAAEDAALRSERICRPNVWIRLGVGGLLLAGLGVAVGLALSVRANVSDLGEASNLAQFVEAILASTVFLGAGIVFLLTLERRYKRTRALNALHELRAIAHVIDMHQLAKDPEGLLKRGPIITLADDQTTKTLFDLNRYLNYCNELLAIVSKIAAMYVQQFPDPAAVSAVDEVENLCSGLSRRIWQKIVVLGQSLDGSRPVG